MGLDMYLDADKFIWSNNNDIKVSGLELYGFELKRISIRVGYWRKVNAVHSWFVTNVQDGEDNCGRYLVRREKLEQLRSACNRVITETDDNNEMAKHILPTQGGFFFGGTNYDEFYIEDLKGTVKIIDKALELPTGWEYYYQSSW